MKNRFLYILASCLLCACGSDSVEDEVNPPTPTATSVDVVLLTEIQTKSATVSRLFKDGDAMSVVAKAYSGTNADAFAPMAKATYGGGKWTMQPPVKLEEGQHTFIYALAPYLESLPSDLSKIPLDLTRQADVLYSGNSVPVSYTTYTAKLTMKHALALISLNIDSQGYTGQGTLQSITVEGEPIYTKATMNIENGKLSGTEQGSLTATPNLKVKAGGWSGDLPRLWTVPFTNKSETVTLTAVIDGKQYTTLFPEVEMRGGYQYIFRLVLTGYGLVFIPEQTETLSLNQDDDSMKGLEGYGLLRITHIATAFTLPALTGDNVFGSVSWGDDSQENYSYNLHHEYGTETAKEVTIESWNTTGFELKTLEGITCIDVGDY